MAFDDSRGRTNGFSTSLITSPRDPNGGINRIDPGPGATGAVTNSFLGGSSGFLQGGGNGGGFTNFSAYLMANPNGAGRAFSTDPTTAGQSGLDSAVNTAYGISNTPQTTVPYAAPPAPPLPLPAGTTTVPTTNTPSPLIPTAPPPQGGGSGPGPSTDDSGFSKKHLR
jgi:hypothetical protein